MPASLLQSQFDTLEERDGGRGRASTVDVAQTPEQIVDAILAFLRESGRSMLISRIETFLVAPRWLFVRIETDDGLVGWGEAVAGGPLGCRAHRHRPARGIPHRPRPARSRTTGRCMTKGGFYRGGAVFASAVSGIDQALWDIAGKALGVPVYRLLGGPVRDRIRVYGWVGGDEPDRGRRRRSRRRSRSGSPR